MNNKVLFWACCMLLLCISGCSKDSIPENVMPVLTTGDVVENGCTVAIVSGRITVPSGSEVQSCGFLYSIIASLPEEESNKMECTLQGVSDTYTAILTNLTPNTTYYYCLYAYSGYTKVLGDVKSFTTLPSSLPVFDRISISNKSENGFAAFTSILDDGGSIITSKGFCWKEATTYTEVPTIDDNTKVLDKSSAFIAHIDNLDTNKLYAVCAYAQNAAGIGYSETVYVSLRDDNPILSVCEVIGVTETEVTFQANIVTNAERISEKGICYSKERPKPTMADNIKKDDSEGSTINVNLKQQADGTQYYIRAYCKKEGEIFYGDVLSYVFGDKEVGIYTLEDLVAFRDDYNATKNMGKWAAREQVTLYADIDMESIDNWIPIKDFNMKFEGNGHKLLNFKITDYYPVKNHIGGIGLFSNLQGNAVIQNLHIGEGSYISLGQTDLSDGGLYIGSVCGVTRTGTDCYITISNCTSMASVSVASDGRHGVYVGGIVGYGGHLVKNCTNYGHISVSAEGYALVGGISGAYADVIENCNNLGNIEAVSKTAYVGGIAGSNVKIVSYCTNTGGIGRGYDCLYAGGIMGKMERYDIYSENVSIHHSTNIGTVNGGSQCEGLGGICGSISGGVIDHNINQGNILNGKMHVGGIIGESSDNNSKTQITYSTNEGEIRSSATNIGSIWGHSGYYNYFENNTNSGVVNGNAGNNTPQIGKDNRFPRLGSTVVENVTSTSVVISSTIIDIGGAPITEKGFCYSEDKKEPNRHYDSVVKDITTDGVNIRATIEGLDSGTKYYIRSYAVNGNWRAFMHSGYDSALGEVKSFTTLLPQ